MSPSTAAHSPEEDEWARIEHIAENAFTFSDICSEPGSTGPSSLTTTGTGVNSTSGVVSHTDIDRDASFDAFPTFGGTRKVDKSEEEQEEEDWMAVVMVCFIVDGIVIVWRAEWVPIIVQGYVPAPQLIDDFDNEDITGMIGKVRMRIAGQKNEQQNNNTEHT